MDLRKMNLYILVRNKINQIPNLSKSLLILSLYLLLDKIGVENI